MPTRSQLESALRNADAAGDVAAAKQLANALKGYQDTTPEQPAPTLSDQRKGVADGMTLPFGPFDTGIPLSQGWAEGLAGAGRRMTDIGSLGTAKRDPAADTLLNDSGAALAGQVGVDIGSLVLGGNALKAGSAIPKIGGALKTAGQALSAPKTLKQAAGAGAAYGALTSQDRASDGVAGAFGAGLGYGVPKALGKAVMPQVKSAAQALMKKGVKLTPGEMFGGFTQRIEDAATSVPVLGDSIRSAKLRSMNQFNKSMINDALGKIGEKLDDSIPAGRESISRAQDMISKQYDDVLSKMDVRIDDELIKSVRNLDALAQDLPTDGAKKVFYKEAQRALDQFGGDNKVALGKTYKEVMSRLRAESTRMQKNNDYAIQNAGLALRELHGSLKEAGMRQYPEMGKKLAQTDTAYAAMKRINDAASAAGSKEGVFTPAKLLAEVRKNTTKNRFAAGQGFDQKLIEGAGSILPSSVPDSGTATRAMVGLGTLGGSAAINPAIPAALLGGAGMYTPLGIKAMQAGLLGGSAWRTPLRKGIEKTAPYGALLGLSGTLSTP